MLCKMVIINIIASNYDLEMILMTSPLSVLLPDISSLFSQQLIPKQQQQQQQMEYREHTKCAEVTKCP